MSNFNDPFDQDVINQRNDAAAVRKRKKSQSSEKLREAQQAYEDQQMLHDLGLTDEDINDEL